MELCQLLGVPTPGSAGDYIFEQDTLALSEARGYADVFKRNHFAWENKAPGKNLDTALKQLVTYGQLDRACGSGNFLFMGPQGAQGLRV